MCGGMPPKLPLCLDQVLYALPFAVIVFLLYLPTVQSLLYPYPWYIWQLSGISGLLALLGKLTGPGRGISLFEPMKSGSKPEKVEILILWLYPCIPTIAYKALILTLCEAIVWAGISFALSPWLILCALIRPAAYFIGWSIWWAADKAGQISVTQTEKGMGYRRIRFMPRYFDTHTAIGEALTGAASGAVLAAIIAFNA